jgi:hypothetical protein
VWGKSGESMEVEIWDVTIKTITTNNRQQKTDNEQVSIEN